MTGRRRVRPADRLASYPGPASRRSDEGRGGAAWLDSSGRNAAAPTDRLLDYFGPSAARKAAVSRVAPAMPGFRTAAFRVPEERHGGAPGALG